MGSTWKDTVKFIPNHSDFSPLKKISMKNVSPLYFAESSFRAMSPLHGDLRNTLIIGRNDKQNKPKPKPAVQLSKSLRGLSSHLMYSFLMKREGNI